MSLEGAIDRKAIPTRDLRGGQLFLRDAPRLLLHGGGISRRAGRSTGLRRRMHHGLCNCGLARVTVRRPRLKA